MDVRMSAAQPVRVELYSARADDGDHIAGAIATTVGNTGRSCPGNLATVDLVVDRGLGKSLRLAIGIGDGRAALRAGGEASVYAIAVGIVGDDEHAPLGVRGTGEAQQNNKADQNCGH